MAQQLFSWFFEGCWCWGSEAHIRIATFPDPQQFHVIKHRWWLKQITTVPGWVEQETLQIASHPIVPFQTHISGSLLHEFHMVPMGLHYVLKGDIVHPKPFISWRIMGFIMSCVPDTLGKCRQKPISDETCDSNQPTMRTWEQPQTLQLLALLNCTE